ncbi:DUF6074 family protein [Rhizobium sp. Leaf383]|uniref:DUF6074 family protein n=1 Tax=Rhizobium sp. Leaf383 TaxID=1736357 RepID=UPI000715746B|nr:DUF6074 family protein [Rhizobium sp. Leaf383]KQS83439.1 hypothetical protein ASG58_22155 [Rhizobium sp. Leaf383]
MTACQMIPFPLASRVGKVRRCAEVLQKTASRESREAYWKRTCRQLREKLEDAGIADAAINDQIRRFRQAVQQEFIRRDYAVMHAGQQPDGAA